MPSVPVKITSTSGPYLFAALRECSDNRVRLVHGVSVRSMIRPRQGMCRGRRTVTTPVRWICSVSKVQRSSGWAPQSGHGRWITPVPISFLHGQAETAESVPAPAVADSVLRAVQVPKADLGLQCQTGSVCGLPCQPAAQAEARGRWASAGEREGGAKEGRCCSAEDVKVSELPAASRSQQVARRASRPFQQPRQAVRGVWSPAAGAPGRCP